MYYPIMLDIRDKNILIVGGGNVAYRKVINLLKSGGKIKVLAPIISEKFEEIQEEIEIIHDEYRSEYLNDIFLVIASTSSKRINRCVKNDANKLNILVNIVDDKDISDFITPAIMENDAIQIGISTKGAFPTLSKYIRKDLEDRYSKYDFEYILLLEELREMVLSNYFEDRKKIFEYSLSLSKNELIKYIEKIRRVK